MAKVLSGQVVHIIDEETKREVVMHVIVSDELTIYNAIYNYPKVRIAKTRVWNPDTLMGKLKASSKQAEDRTPKQIGDIFIYKVNDLKNFILNAFECSAMKATVQLSIALPRDRNNRLQDPICLKLDN
jgi:hypothetical protein